ncbi:MAG: tRNA dihydrouridine synthase DusB, partial [Jatrophihabitantaceae bacterium]
VAWYLKGFAIGGEIRVALAQAASLRELDGLLARIDPAQPFPQAVLGLPRGRTSGARAVVLPEGWLGSRDSRAVPAGAELDTSGG